MARLPRLTGKEVISVLAQLGILRTLARHTRVQVGVYAAVERGGTIRCGDAVRLE